MSQWLSDTISVASTTAMFFNSMYDHGSFSSEPKLLSEISRRPEHVATFIEYVKKVYGRANL